MYVIKTYPGCWPSQQLHELDKKGLELAKKAYPNHHFRVVSGAEAHKWVRNGLHHSTPLWIDGNGRIRYARDAR